MSEIIIGNRRIGSNHPPLVIAEIGINHEGDEAKAMKMIDDAHKAGCECVKFQTHVVDDEMIENDVVPANADETIWDMMKRCALSVEAEKRLKDYSESLGMIFLSTPFSRAAADRLEILGVSAYKIGSGECNNYPLLKHVASFGKPIILSTGMNSIDSIAKAVNIFRDAGVQYALLHCTSLYPTPYEKVRLGCVSDLADKFEDGAIGLSDHSLSIYPCLGAVALGASILERHFTSDKSWPGPDIEVSMDPEELRELIIGSNAIFLARGGHKELLEEESVTAEFAYACVVSTQDIPANGELTDENIWVKRPGTGEIFAEDYEQLLGRKVKNAIAKNQQLKWGDLV